MNRHVTPAGIGEAPFGIGQPVPRKEDPILVRGEGRYTDDLSLDGQLYAAFVRSPHAHGVLNGIAAVLPRFTVQGGGHVINVASIAAHMVMPSAAVYCGTKHAVRAITEGLRLEHDDIRATLISPGVVATELGHDITDPAIAEALIEWRKQSLTPDAIARAVRFALEQPAGVDVNEIIVRPTSANM